MVTEAEVRWLMEPGTVHEPSLLFEILRQRPAWMKRAACRGEPTERFFPGRGDDVRPALELCRACPVRRECADYALGSTAGTLGLSGIWGGLSARQRRRLREGELLGEAG